MPSSGGYIHDTTPRRRRRTVRRTSRAVGAPPPKFAGHVGYDSGSSVGPGGTTGPAASGGASQAAANRAYRHQQALIKKYVFHQEKAKLVEKNVKFNKQGEAVGLRDSPRQIGEDLHEAAERIRKLDITDLPDHVQQKITAANSRGKIIKPKKIFKIAERDYQTSVRASITQDIGGPGVYQGPKQANLLGSKLFQSTRQALKPAIVAERKRTQHPGANLGQIYSDIRQAGRAVGAKGLFPDKKDQLHPKTPTAKDAALLAAGVLAPEVVAGTRVAEGALSSRIVQSLFKVGGKALPEATRLRTAASLGKVAKRYPGVTEGLKYHPIKTVGGGTLAASAPAHPVRTAQDIANLSAAADDFRKNPGGYIAHAARIGASLIAHSPEALLKTGESLASSGKAREAALYGARSLAFGAISFPVLAVEQSLAEGPTAFAHDFAAQTGEDLNFYLDPIVKGDMKTYEKRLEEGGGAAFALSFLLPALHLADIGAKGIPETITRAGATLKAEGKVGKRGLKYLTERPDLQYAPLRGTVKGQKYSRGLALTHIQKALDVTRKVARKNRVTEEGRVPPLLFGGRRTHKQMSRIREEEKVAGVQRAVTDLAKLRKTYRKLGGGDRGALAFYAQELNFKDTRSAIDALQHEINMKRHYQGNVRGAGAEIPVLEGLVRSLRSGKLKVDAKMLARVGDARAIVRRMNVRAPQLETEATAGRMSQVEVRALGPQAEHLATRPGSRLPKIEKAVGPDANWRDNWGTYVREVGAEAIRAEARRVGLGDPGYVFHTPAVERAKMPGFGRRERAVGAEPTSLELYRAGARDARAYRTLQQMERLNHTIAEVDAKLRFDDEGTQPLEFFVPKDRRVRHTKKSDEDLTSQEIIDVLHDSGLENADLKHLRLVNTGLLRNKFRIWKDKRSNRNTDIESELDNIVRSSSVSAYDRAHGINPIDLAEHDNGWMLTTEDAFNAFAPEPLGSGRIGPLAQVYARAKVLASRYLLARPSWLLFQVYANAYLSGIAKPGAFAAPGFRTYMKHLDEVGLREHFERGVGVPQRHIDYGNVGGSLIASYVGWKSKKDAEFYQLHLAGKNPLDAFFRLDQKQNHHFTSRVLYSEQKKAAYESMGGRMNRIMTLLDRHTNLRGGKKVQEYDVAMDGILKDPRARDAIAQETHDFMGDYLTFTPAERRYLANNFLFYGFMRHSLMLTLWTLPVKHPLRAAVLAQSARMVEANQRKAIENSTRIWLARMLAANADVSAEQAEEWAANYHLENNQIPFNMMGTFVFPDGRVIDLRRASFAGSLPVTLKSPWQVISAMNPILQGGLEMITGLDFYSGNPVITDPEQQAQMEDYALPFVGAHPIPLGALPSWFASTTLGYVSPVREVSQAVSKYPPFERTGTSFPLPFGLGGESPLVHNKAYKQERQEVQRQIQIAAQGGMHTFWQEAPGGAFVPHSSYLVPSLGMKWIQDQANKSYTIKKHRDEKKSKKSTTGIHYPSGKSKGLSYPKLGKAGGLTYPGEEKKSSDTTPPLTYAKYLRRALTTVFRSGHMDPGGGKIHEDGGKTPTYLGREPKSAPAGLRLYANLPDKERQKLSKKKDDPHKKGGHVVKVPAGVPDEYKAAVGKFGKLVDKAAAGTGMSGAEYLAKTIQFESGWDPTAENESSGAYGLGQFMPDTAATFKSQYGVDPLNPKDPSSMIKAAAMHLSGDYGHAALYAGYNPGYGADPVPGEDVGPMVKVRVRGGVPHAVGMPKAEKVPRKVRRYFKKEDGSEHLRFNPIFMKHLVKLARLSGEPLVVSSGFRTYKEQEASYADYKAGGALAAVPGTSNHEFGLAADLSLSDKQRALLGKAGLSLPVPGEDWHVEVADEAERTKAGYGSVGTTSAGGGAAVPSTGGIPGVPTMGSTGTSGASIPTPTTRAGATPIEALSQLRKGGGAGLALGGLLEGVTPAGSGTPPTGGAPTIEQMQAIATEIAAARKKLLSR